MFVASLMFERTLALRLVGSAMRKTNDVRVACYSSGQFCGTRASRDKRMRDIALEWRTMSYSRLLPLLLLPAALTALSQTSLPHPPAAHVVTISPADSRGSEPGIAVNPGNPSQVVAVYQPATVAYSSDGAQTFALADLPPV